jgi:thioredoxin 1
VFEFAIAVERKIMAGKSTLTFTSDNFEQEVLNSKVPVLVDFWAEWCGPCKVLGPTIDALADGYGERAKVGKLNVDEHPAIAAKYGVRSIPTVILFARGAVQDTVIGVQPQQQYIRRLDALSPQDS